MVMMTISPAVFAAITGVSDTRTYNEQDRGTCDVYRVCAGTQAMRPNNIRRMLHGFSREDHDDAPATTRFTAIIEVSLR